MMLHSLVGGNYLPVCRLQHHKQDCNIQVVITSPSLGLGFCLIFILFLFFMSYKWDNIICIQTLHLGKVNP